MRNTTYNKMRQAGYGARVGGVITENISRYVTTVSAEARDDMANNRWDEVMTDALYAACGAETTEEMAEARDIAGREANAQHCENKR